MSETPTTLRLFWPQWQGATADNIEALFPEIPLATAKQGYSVGTRVMHAILPPATGPVVVAPVDFSDDGTEHKDGIDAKDAVVKQLASALGVIAEHDADRIVTFGGECSVSVAPFSVLAERYGDDVALVWVDSHPDVGTPDSEYPGYHAMAVSALTGHGDPAIVGQLPGLFDPSRVALAGLHSWTDDDFPNAAKWGISTFSPDALRGDSTALLEWLAATGCSKVAVHIDVDVVDADEMTLGLGIEPGGLSSTQVRRLLADLDSAAEVVGLTIAEYIPRQVMQLASLLDDLPLIGSPVAKP